MQWKAAVQAVALRGNSPWPVLAMERRRRKAVRHTDLTKKGREEDILTAELLA